MRWAIHSAMRHVETKLFMYRSELFIKPVCILDCVRPRSLMTRTTAAAAAKAVSADGHIETVPGLRRVVVIKR